MNYQMLVLDLDGTLTNSRKEITPATKQGLMEIQEAGKILVLASGRPINGVAPLAAQLHMERYGGYMLSFNGARITKCSTGELIYNRTIPPETIRPIWEYFREFPGLDVISYTDTCILSGICPNQYVEIESGINKMDVTSVDDFPSALDFPVNKLLGAGDPELLEKLIPILKEKYHGLLSIYRSEPYFLEIMPQHVDKALSLQKRLSSMGLTAEEMICCGDGFNDLTMIEYAGLGVAMGNAQPLIKDSADYITASNDEDGILQVINHFMR